MQCLVHNNTGHFINTIISVNVLASIFHQYTSLYTRAGILNQSVSSGCTIISDPIVLAIMLYYLLIPICCYILVLTTLLLKS